MIRPLTKIDIPIIVSWEQELLGESIGKVMLSSELQNKYAYFFVIEEESLIGYIGAWIIDGTCEIINFLINTPFQNQGYGTQLLSAITKQALNLGASEIILEVKEKNNQAIKFYKKHGFIQINMRMNYYHDGQNALVMRKELYEDTSN